MATFALTEVGGPAWDPAVPMRQQEGWPEHAAFMDALVEEGFVLLGGPIGDGSSHRILLIVEAVDEAAVRARLAADPWLDNARLSLTSVDQWTVLLGKPGRI
jgi:uncharacterized protein YciI